MTIWSPKIQQGARVKYVGIVEAIEADIKNHTLKPGDKLPAQRQIAVSLNVDLTTVTRAINEAVRRGLVETYPGSGCLIAQTAFSHYRSLSLIEGKPLDLSMNNPPVLPNLNMEELIAKTIIDIGNNPDRSCSHLCYQETAGHPRDREAGTQWLTNRIQNISADTVLISNGAHSAIFSVLSHLRRAGTKVIAAPEFCYPGLRAIADHLGLDVYSVEMDSFGIRTDSLVEIIDKFHPSALYLIPNIDNPTTTTLPAERRHAIAQLAKSNNVTLIEDDPYYPFLDKSDLALPSLYSLAPELTWHIATVSKCLSPTLRVAYIVAPSSDQALSLAEEIRVSSIMAPPLMSAVVAEWIRNGQMSVITETIKQENINRQTLAASVFKPKQNITNAAPHLWIKLPRGMRALDFSERAIRNGVSIVPSTAFVTTRSQTQAVRISLGITTDYRALHDAIKLLSELLNSTTNSTNFII